MALVNRQQLTKQIKTIITLLTAKKLPIDFIENDAFQSLLQNLVIATKENFEIYYYVDDIYTNQDLKKILTKIKTDLSVLITNLSNEATSATLIYIFHFKKNTFAAIKRSSENVDILLNYLDQANDQDDIASF